MTLDEGTVGKTYVVAEVQEEIQTQRRLAALGLINGTRVRLLNKKKKGAVIFSVRGTRFAIGKVIAKGIFIEEEKING